MGHIMPRAYLGSWRWSARNYTRQQWRVVAQCVNNLHISIKSAYFFEINEHNDCSVPKKCVLSVHKLPTSSATNVELGDISGS
jgi:hypothetical protein